MRQPGQTIQAMTPPKATPPEFVERYGKGPKLGQGSMGVVSEVYDRSLHTRVAWKTVRPGAPERHHRSLVAEARLLSSLDHPGIISVVDRGFLEDGRPYYTMDLVRGTTFEEILTHEDPSIEACVELLLQACDALSYAHDRGIVHCDLKPSNMLIDEKGQLLLIDWGTSEEHIKENGSRRKSGEKRTQKSQGYIVNGTPLYIAPEVLRGASPGPQSDQYAIGVMLYELLARQYPFFHNNVLTLFTEICVTPPTPPSALPERASTEIPAELEEICLQLLSKKPEERFESCGALAERLQRWLDGRRRIDLPEAPDRAAWFAPPISF